MGEILWIALTYLLGSVSYGVVIAKIFCHVDPRAAGSGNVGATNVARLCGFRWGAATLLCDLLKGALPVAVALYWINDSALFVSAVALAAVSGHRFSCFLGFRGGKAVAAAIGVFLPLAFWQLLISAIVCLAVIWRSGFVSLGSLSLVTVLPVLLAFSGAWQWLPLSLICMCLIFWTHKENIVRLLQGTEKPWQKKKFSETAEEDREKGQDS